MVARRQRELVREHRLVERRKAGDAAVGDARIEMLRGMGHFSTLKLRVCREERQPRFRADTEPEALSSIPEQQPGTVRVGGVHLRQQARPPARQRRRKSRLERLHRRAALHPYDTAAHRRPPDRSPRSLVHELEPARQLDVPSHPRLHLSPTDNARMVRLAT